MFFGDQSHHTHLPTNRNDRDSHIHGPCVNIWRKLKAEFLPLEFWSVLASKASCKLDGWGHPPTWAWRTREEIGAGLQEAQRRNPRLRLRNWILSPVSVLVFCKILHVSCPWALWDSHTNLFISLYSFEISSLLATKKTWSRNYMLHFIFRP